MSEFQTAAPRKSPLLPQPVIARSGMMWIFAKFDDAVSSWPWKTVYSLATKKPDESTQAIWKTVFGVRKPSSDEAE